jgi:hypothetical protein
MDVATTLARSTRPVKQDEACQTPSMTDLPPPMADPRSRLAMVRDGFAWLRPRVVAGEPWALAEDFGTGPEASWGPREVLAHTAEMLPFWLGEYERVVEAGRGAGDGQPFGRTSEDPLRIGILERDRTLPLRELFDRIDAGIDRWERRLSDAPAGEDEAMGRHPRLGEMNAGQLCVRFVLTHLEEHAAQLDAILMGR